MLLIRELIKWVKLLDHLQPTSISISIFFPKIEKFYNRGENAPMYTFIIEFLYFRGKYRGKLFFTSILDISILEEIIEIYIGDALNHLVEGVCS